MTAWSRERPTKAGWYWWRDLPSAEAQPVKVLAYSDGSAMTHCDYGEWQGPLEPKE